MLGASTTIIIRRVIMKTTVVLRLLPFHIAFKPTTLYDRFLFDILPINDLRFRKRKALVLKNECTDPFNHLIELTHSSENTYILYR